MQAPQYVLSKVGVSTNSTELKLNQQRLLQYLFSYSTDKTHPNILPGYPKNHIHNLIMQSSKTNSQISIHSSPMTHNTITTPTLPNPLLSLKSIKISTPKPSKIHFLMNSVSKSPSSNNLKNTAKSKNWPWNKKLSCIINCWKTRRPWSKKTLRKFSSNKQYEILKWNNSEKRTKNNMKN